MPSFKSTPTASNSIHTQPQVLIIRKASKPKRMLKTLALDNDQTNKTKQNTENHRICFVLVYYC